MKSLKTGQLSGGETPEFIHQGALDGSYAAQSLVGWNVTDSWVPQKVQQVLFTKISDYKTGLMFVQEALKKLFVVLLEI